MYVRTQGIKMLSCDIDIIPTSVRGYEIYDAIGEVQG